MANDIDIKVGVQGGQDILKLTKDLNKTEDGVRKLALAFKQGKVTNQALLVGLNQQVAAVKKLGVSHSVASNKVFAMYRQMKDLTEEQLRFQTVSGKGMRRYEVLAQQAGYQIGDLAVQIQGGTNAAVALGQQGSQLLGFFGPAGAIAGAGLAITTAFVAPFMKANKEIKDVNKQLDELVRLTDSVTVDFDKLADKFGDSAQAIKDLRTQLLGLQADLTSSALSKGVEGLAKKFGSTYLQTFLRTLPMGSLIMGSPERAMKSMGFDPELMGVGFLDEFSKAISAGDPELATILFENMLDAIDSSETGMQGLSAEGKALVLQLQNMLETAIEIDHQFSKLTLGDAQTDALERSMALQEDMIRRGQEAQAERDAGRQAQQERAMALQEDMIRRGQEAQARRDETNHKARLKYMDLEAAKQVRLGLVPYGISMAGLNTAAQIYKGRKAQEEADAKAAARRAKDLEKAIDLTRELTDAQKQQVAIADSVSGAFGDFFMGLVDGTTSAKDAFRSMAADIIRELYRIMVVEQMVQSLKAGIMGFFSPASAAGTAGSMAPPVRPTGVFDGGGYTGSGPRSGGLDGKGGFMAMLHPRETVVDHTKGQSTGGEVINVTQNINVSTGVQQTVRAEIKQLMPQIADNAKAAVVDAKRRGGSYGRAFS